MFIVQHRPLDIFCNIINNAFKAIRNFLKQLAHQSGPRKWQLFAHLTMSLFLSFRDRNDLLVKFYVGTMEIAEFGAKWWLKILQYI